MKCVWGGIVIQYKMTDTITHLCKSLLRFHSIPVSFPALVFAPLSILLLSVL